MLAPSLHAPQYCSCSTRIALSAAGAVFASFWFLLRRSRIRRDALTRVSVFSRRCSAVTDRSPQAGIVERGARTPLGKYLHQVRQTVLAKSAERVHIVHAVLGNEAADLDSMVSAVAYAFMLHCENRHATPRRENVVFVPIVNAPKGDFMLRGEASAVFGHHGGGVRGRGCLDDPGSELIFIDEIDLRALLAAGRLEVSLVDHNRLSGEQEFLEPALIGIVDHHKDEHLYAYSIAQNGGHRLLEQTGSCASLIAEEIKKCAPELLANDGRDCHGVAQILLAAVVLDTNNMSAVTNKGTPRDRAIRDELHRIVVAQSDNADEYKHDETPGGDHSPSGDFLEFDASLDLEALCVELVRLRSDVSNLTWAQILIKDVKFGTAGSTRYAIATIPLSLQCCFDSRDEFLGAVRNLARDRALQVIGVMSAYSDAHSGTFKRQLFLWSSVPALEQRLGDYLAASDILGLTEASTPPAAHTVAYEQRIVSSSRKQIRPLLVDFLAGNTPKCTL